VSLAEARSLLSKLVAGQQGDVTQTSDSKAAKASTVANPAAAFRATPAQSERRSCSANQHWDGPGFSQQAEIRQLLAKGSAAGKLRDPETLSAASTSANSVVSSAASSSRITTKELSARAAEQLAAMRGTA